MLSHDHHQRRQVFLVALAFIAFISLGLPDGLLGVAWPYMRADFSQPLDAMGLILVALTSGYLVSSFFSGAVVRRIGIGLLLSVSVAATATALIGYTLAPAWWLVIVASSLLGAGAGAIDAGLNNYVAANHSDGLMQWLHASFGVGVTIGPLIMTGGLGLTDTWRTGYLLVGGAQLLLAIAFLLTARLWESKKPLPSAAQSEQPAPKPKRVADAPLKATWGHRNAWLSLMLFFIYSGLELTVGLWAFSLLTESRGLPRDQAALWVSLYWGMFTVGRVVAGVFAGRLGVDRVILFSLALAMLSALLLWWSPQPWVALLALVLAGFAYAPIFPAMVSGTRMRVPANHITNTMGMQFSGAGLGAAILPALAGAIAARTSLEAISPFLLVLALLVLAVYGWARLAPVSSPEQAPASHD